MNLTVYKQICYDSAKAKGFHDNERSWEEAIMLIISEVGELIDAHRHDKHITVADIKSASENMNFEDKKLADTLMQTFYSNRVKGTVEEELADVFIRTMDLMYEFEIDPSDNDDLGNFTPSKVPGQVDLYTNLHLLTESLTNNFMETDSKIMTAIALLERICWIFGIQDLQPFVDFKLKYNAIRPTLHGKTH